MDSYPTKSAFLPSHPFLSRPIFPTENLQKSPEAAFSIDMLGFATPRAEITLPMTHLLTPETPSFQQSRVNHLNFSPLQKTLPSSKKASLEKSPFRPWDTPLSLSPQSSEPASSSPESNKTSSPPSHTSSPCEDLTSFQLSSPEGSTNSSPPFLKPTYPNVSPPSLQNYPPTPSSYAAQYNILQLQQASAAAQSFPIDLSDISKSMYVSPETKYETENIFTQSFLNSVKTPVHPLPINNFNTPYFSSYGDTTKPSYKDLNTPDFPSLPSIPTPANISPPVAFTAIPLKQNLKKTNDQNKKRKKKQLKFQENAISASPVFSRKLSRKSPIISGQAGSHSSCLVCGLKATGVHYGALACEGCKGFFRRRVISRDVVSLVCGGGGRVQVNGSGRVDGRCQVKGRGRIICRLCRYHSCLDAGMNPHAVRPEKKHKLPFPEQILSLQKDTMEMVPAVYLGRSHGENLPLHVARSYPESADLSLSGASSVRQFITSLPGWEDLPQEEKNFSLSEGSLMVMLLRLTSRYRPESGAFLFPCGKFLFVNQLHNLPPAAQSSLQYLASDLANRGLTKQEMSLLSVLLASRPTTSLHTQAMQALEHSASLIHLLMMVPCFGELARQATWESWMKPF